MNLRRSHTQAELVLIGGGGHALVVAEAALAANLTIAGFYDDDTAAMLGDMAPWLGDLVRLEDELSLPNRQFIIGVGDLRLRRRLISLLADATPATVVHPSAMISPSAKLAPGVFVAPGAIVHACAAIGAHAIINSAAVIEHHVEIGENSHIAPRAVLGGAARVGRDTLIGLGASVTPGAQIGDRCVVGVGAAVIGDVADGDCVVGVPAKSVSKAHSGGR